MKYIVHAAFLGVRVQQLCILFLLYSVCKVCAFEESVVFES